MSRCTISSFIESSPPSTTTTSVPFTCAMATALSTAACATSYLPAANPSRSSCEFGVSSLVTLTPCLANIPSTSATINGIVETPPNAMTLIGARAGGGAGACAPCVSAMTSASSRPVETVRRRNVTSVPPGPPAPARCPTARGGPAARAAAARRRGRHPISRSRWSRCRCQSCWWCLSPST